MTSKTILSASAVMVKLADLSPKILRISVPLNVFPHMVIRETLPPSVLSVSEKAGTVSVVAGSRCGAILVMNSALVNTALDRVLSAGSGFSTERRYGRLACHTSSEFSVLLPPEEKKHAS